VESKIFIQNLIEDFVDIDETLLELGDVVADFGLRDEDFISDFFIAFREDEVGVFFDFFVELFNDFGLVEVGGFGFIEDGGFLTFLYEDCPQVIKPVCDDLTVGEMNEFFLDIFFSFLGLGSDGMGFGKDNSTELYDKLLEAKVIKFLGFPLIQQFDIDIPDKILYFGVGGEEVHFVVFEELDELDDGDSLFALLALVEGSRLTRGVHAVGVLEEEVAEEAVVLFEQVVDYLDVFGLHQLWGVQFEVFGVLFVELLPKTVFLYLGLLRESSQQVDLLPLLFHQRLLVDLLAGFSLFFELLLLLLSPFPLYHLCELLGQSGRSVLVVPGQVDALTGAFLDVRLLNHVH
jgi:hypothetical protein